MDRRKKATENKHKAAQLNEEWKVGAVQGRYSDNGRWYAKLVNFPAALFDAHGYVLFETEDDYFNSPYLSINKQVGIGKPGISAIPSYVRVVNDSPDIDVDIHAVAVIEGRQRLVLHLQRERNRTVVKNKKKSATSLDCEVCGFSFERVYGSEASSYCEVHHLMPLSEVEENTKTKMEDLAILCANCHRVVHLTNPPFTLDEVRSMLAK